MVIKSCRVAHEEPIPVTEMLLFAWHWLLFLFLKLKQLWNLSLEGLDKSKHVFSETRNLVFFIQAWVWGFFLSIVSSEHLRSDRSENSWSVDIPTESVGSHDPLQFNALSKELIIDDHIEPIIDDHIEPIIDDHIESIVEDKVESMKDRIDSFEEDNQSEFSPFINDLSNDTSLQSYGIMEESDDSTEDEPAWLRSNRSLTRFSGYENLAGVGSYSSFDSSVEEASQVEFSKDDVLWKSLLDKYTSKEGNTRTESPFIDSLIEEDLVPSDESSSLNPTIKSKEIFNVHEDSDPSSVSDKVNENVDVGKVDFDTIDSYERLRSSYLELDSDISEHTESSVKETSRSSYASETNNSNEPESMNTLAHIESIILDDVNTLPKELISSESNRSILNEDESVDDVNMLTTELISSESNQSILNDDESVGHVNLLPTELMSSENDENNLYEDEESVDDEDIAVVYDLSFNLRQKDSDAIKLEVTRKNDSPIKWNKNVSISQNANSTVEVSQPCNSGLLETEFPIDMHVYDSDEGTSVDPQSFIEINCPSPKAHRDQESPINMPRQLDNTSQKSLSQKSLIKVIDANMPSFKISYGEMDDIERSISNSPIDFSLDYPSIEMLNAQSIKDLPKASLSGDYVELSFPFINDVEDVETDVCEYLNHDSPFELVNANDFTEPSFEIYIEVCPQVLGYSLMKSTSETFSKKAISFEKHLSGEILNECVVGAETTEPRFVMDLKEPPQVLALSLVKSTSETFSKKADSFDSSFKEHDSNDKLHVGIENMEPSFEFSSNDPPQLLARSMIKSTSETFSKKADSFEISLHETETATRKKKTGSSLHTAELCVPETLVNEVTETIHNSRENVLEDSVPLFNEIKQTSVIRNDSTELVDLDSKLKSSNLPPQILSNPIVNVTNEAFSSVDELTISVPSIEKASVKKRKGFSKLDAEEFPAKPVLLNRPISVHDELELFEVNEASPCSTASVNASSSVIDELAAATHFDVRKLVRLLPTCSVENWNLKSTVKMDSRKPSEENATKVFSTQADNLGQRCISTKPDILIHKVERKTNSSWNPNLFTDRVVDDTYNLILDKEASLEKISDESSSDIKKGILDTTVYDLDSNFDPQDDEVDLKSSYERNVSLDRDEVSEKSIESFTITSKTKKYDYSLTREEEAELADLVGTDDVDEDEQYQRYLHMPVGLTDAEKEELDELDGYGSFKDRDREELEKYLRMPIGLTEQEQREIEELLEEDATSETVNLAAQERLASLLAAVRLKNGYLGGEESDDDTSLHNYMTLPVALTEEEEILLNQSADGEYDLIKDEEYRENIKRKFLDDLEAEEDHVLLDEYEFNEEFGSDLDDDSLYHYEDINYPEPPVVNNKAEDSIVPPPRKSKKTTETSTKDASSSSNDKSSSKSSKPSIFSKLKSKLN